MNKKHEVWLRGPLDDIPALLQPVAHALLQAREEIDILMHDFADALLWERPAGVASPAFHLQHLSGVLDRLFTYARGEQLTQIQLDFLEKEGKPVTGLRATDLTGKFNQRVDDALSQLRNTDASILTEKREVGRDKLPSTVIGLYTHAAEHTMRHVGQLFVTVRILKQK